ncbi:MAG: hypothetical protein GWN84_27180 [Gammaproteobacteria bacterium]|nr:hypothetical protein [Gammaproteobacteria bacterium]NIR86018.1 hypothetical protein [Gammaproteobacteria bacterium]NIU07259.1 hypothetical protein [Gammaproteobacteria bacterium]NIV54064.1 hypothetical protein [Gammaproteobacteria bacterium]NIX88532.1 hypothetical protein [Gammaproteobacteria bacterium]
MSSLAKKLRRQMQYAAKRKVTSLLDQWLAVDPPKCDLSLAPPAWKQAHFDVHRTRTGLRIALARFIETPDETEWWVLAFRQRSALRDSDVEQLTAVADRAGRDSGLERAPVFLYVANHGRVQVSRLQASTVVFVWNNRETAIETAALRHLCRAAWRQWETETCQPTK